MTNLLDDIDEILLMGPGPSCVHPEVYKALNRFTLGHLDPHFIKIMDQIQVLLQKLLNTENKLTIPVSGTGSAGMNEVATRLGADVDIMEFEWGTPIDPEKVKEKLSDNSYSLIAMVHAETSTGVKNPIEEISHIIKDTESLFLVDAVTSLGGIEVKVDDWGIDAIYSGTQKCLSVPPGLAPVSFSEKALSKIKNRKTRVPNWYLDMSLVGEYWQKDHKRAYHHTAPINMLYALYQALLLFFEEGAEKVFQRHTDCHNKLKAGLRELGLKMYVEGKFRLPMLNAVSIPEGIDEAEVRKKLRFEHKIEIGGGLGPLAGKIWRIGVMGHTAQPENIERFLSALKSVL